MDVLDLRDTGKEFDWWIVKGKGATPAGFCSVKKEKGLIKIIDKSLFSLVPGRDLNPHDLKGQGILNPFKSRHDLSELV